MKLYHSFVPIWCGQQDSNLHALAVEPKSTESTNSTMPAKYYLPYFITPGRSCQRYGIVGMIDKKNSLFLPFFVCLHLTFRNARSKIHSVWCTLPQFFLWRKCCRNWQEGLTEDFVPNWGLENAGILDVFLVFQTDKLVQKIIQSPHTISSALTRVRFMITGDAPGFYAFLRRMAFFWAYECCILRLICQFYTCGPSAPPLRRSQFLRRRCVA